MLATHHLDTSAAAPPFAAVPVPPRTWFKASPADQAGGYRHLLILRFAVLNLVALALLGAAWLKGWVTLVIDGDSTGLVMLIALVFLAGLIECGRRLWQINRGLDEVRGAGAVRSARLRHYLDSVRGRDGQGRAIAGSALKLRLAGRIAPIRNVANSLVLLGLIGTVIGFIIALSGVDAAAAADVNRIGPMVTTLIQGMSVALYTTLVGAILNIWLMVNYRLLESGTIHLLSALIERGERHA